MHIRKDGFDIVDWYDAVETSGGLLSSSGTFEMFNWKMKHQDIPTYRKPLSPKHRDTSQIDVNP